MKRCDFSYAWIAAAALAVGVAAAEGGFVNEPFDYGEEGGVFTVDVGGDGGVGWAGPWSVDQGSFDYLVRSSTNLSYDVGGYVNDEGTGRLEFTGGDNRISRSFAEPFEAGSTVWGSFLVFSPGGRAFGAFDRAHLWINEQQGNRIGFNGNNWDSELEEPVEGNLEVTIDGSTTVLDSAPVDAVNLLIFKMETNYDGDFDRLTAWTNPTSTISDEASLGAGAVFDGQDIWGDDFASISFEGRWANGRPDIDSIRFSTDLSRVIPEPAALSLLGLGGLMLLRRGRRAG